VEAQKEAATDVAVDAYVQELKGERLIVEVVRAGVVIGSAIGEVSGEEVAFEVCCRPCQITAQCTYMRTTP
jgi:hypothetical protein